MISQEDSAYFAARSREERRLSLMATDERVAAAHAELAERYYRISQGEESIPIRLVQNSEA